MLTLRGTFALKAGSRSSSRFLGVGSPVGPATTPRKDSSPPLVNIRGGPRVFGGVLAGFGETEKKSVSGGLKTCDPKHDRQNALLTPEKRVFQFQPGECRDAGQKGPWGWGVQRVSKGCRTGPRVPRSPVRGGHLLFRGIPKFAQSPWTKRDPPQDPKSQTPTWRDARNDPWGPFLESQGFSPDPPLLQPPAAHRAFRGSGADFGVPGRLPPPRQGQVLKKWRSPSLGMPHACTLGARVAKSHMGDPMSRDVVKPGIESFSQYSVPEKIQKKFSYGAKPKFPVFQRENSTFCRKRLAPQNQKENLQHPLLISRSLPSPPQTSLGR